MEFSILRKQVTTRHSRPNTKIKHEWIFHDFLFSSWIFDISISSTKFRTQIEFVPEDQSWVINYCGQLLEVQFSMLFTGIDLSVNLSFHEGRYGSELLLGRTELMYSWTKGAKHKDRRWINQTAENYPLSKFAKLIFQLKWSDTFLLILIKLTQFSRHLFWVNCFTFNQSFPVSWVKNWFKLALNDDKEMWQDDLWTSYETIPRNF